MDKVSLKCSDGKVFVVDLQIVKTFKTLKIMLEECGFENDDIPEIPLPKVDSVALQSILDWANYHKDKWGSGEANADRSARDSTPIEPWDRDFIASRKDILFEIILAANYLDIKELQALCYKSVANLIRGKTPMEIRETFGIRNDFTPDEEEQIRNENSWAIGDLSDDDSME